VSAVAVNDEQGYVKYYDGIIDDITEHKRAEEELNKQKDLLQTVIDNIPVMITYFDESGKIQLINNDVVKNLGWTFEEWKTEDIYSKCYPDPEYLKYVHDFMSRKSKNWLDFKTVTKDGKVIDTSWINILLPNGISMGIGQNITERKRVEEALQESEGKLKKAQEIGKIGNWEYDVITEDIKWSEQVFVLFERDIELGPPTEAEEAKNYTEKQAKILKDLARQCIKTGLECQIDIDPVLPSGRRVHYASTLKPVKDENGKVIKLLGIIQDITERKQAESQREAALEALKKSNQLLRDTGAMAQIGGWELDLSTQEVSWTEEVGRIHGVEPGYRLKLEEAINFYVPEFRPALEAGLKKAAETGEPYDLESHFIPQSSKDWIWVRSLGRAVYSDGKITKLAGTFQNIDKYKRVEVALQVSLEKYRVLFESFPLGITISNKSGMIIEGNRQSEKLLGITLKEHVERRIDSKEWQIIRKDGTPMPADEYASSRDGHCK
jgi:PAS domain S-box-containing protein